MIARMLRGFGRRPHVLLVLTILLGPLFLPAKFASAHEATMAVISLREIGPGRYVGSWLMPPADESLRPIFPEHCRWEAPELDCGDRGLIGRLSFMGLGSKQSVATIRVIPRDGAVQVY